MYVIFVVSRFVFYILYCSLYTIWTKLYLKTYTNWKLHAILKQHKCTFKVATTHEMIIMYYLCPVMIVHYTMELVNATEPSLWDKGSMC
jgi:hypothetical protein